MAFGAKRTYAGYYASPAKRSKKSASSSTSNQLRLLKRKVNALKPETKIALATGTFTNVVTAVGAISYLLQVAQGVTKSTRLGDQIRVKRIQFRMLGTSAVTTVGVCNRIFLVRDYASIGGSFSITGGITSFLNVATSLGQVVAQNVDRFKVIKDVTYAPLQQTSGTISGEILWDIPMDLLVDFTSTGATSSDSGKNALYIVVVTDDTAGTQDWSYSANIHYTDV